MGYYDEDLDMTNNKIKHIESSVAELQDSILQLMHELKETQKFLIKLAHNQGEITKRVSMWPYIAVPEGDGGGKFSNDN